MNESEIIDEAALRLAGQDEVTKMVLLDKFVIAFSAKARDAGFSESQIDTQIEEIVVSLAARVLQFEASCGRA